MIKYYKVGLQIIDGNQDLRCYKTIENLIRFGTANYLQDIIVYKKGFKFRELITDIEIPHFIVRSGKDKISKISPVYFCYKEKESIRSTIKTLEELQVYHDEVESYLKENLDISKYDDTSNRNYIDPKTMYERKIISYFNQGEEEIAKFAEKYFLNTKKRRLKERQEYVKIKKIVNDYLKK